MSQVPSKVAARLSAAIKRFQPVVASAKSRDANESDTVIIVTDMLSEVFGYDKYSEITSEMLGPPGRHSIVDRALDMFRTQRTLVA